MPPFPPTPAPGTTPAPAPDILDIGTDVKPLDGDTTKSKEAKDKDSKSSKKPPAATEGGRRSRAPLAILGLLVIAGGGAVGGMYAGVVPDYLGIKPIAGETPVAEVTPTPAPTATAEATETTVAVASATPEETATPAPTETTATPAATATVAATPTPAPTATAVAVVATPKATPTPAPTKAPEDPEVAKKKAAALVKIGNDALNAGDGTKAVRNFGAAIAKDPNNAEAYLGLGTAYMLQGENAKAKSSFKKFLQLAPDHQYAAQTRQILGTL